MFSTNHPNWKWLAELNDERLAALLQEFRSKTIEDYSFCSLSENHNDILMWSHYGNSHKGIVLGIEFEGIEENQNIHKIKYQNKLNEFDLKRFAKFQIGQEKGFIFDIFKDYAVKSNE